jgi:hypothetical protein
MRRGIGDMLMDAGEFLKDFAARQKGSINYKEERWNKGAINLANIMLCCEDIDRRRGTDYAHSTGTSVWALLGQYQLFRRYALGDRPTNVTMREVAGYLAMVATLERRFRQSRFYGQDRLDAVTHRLFDQGIKCFETIGIGKSLGYDYPKTLEDFLKEYSGVIESKDI